MKTEVKLSGPIFQRPDLAAALSEGMDQALTLIAHRLQANLSGGIVKSGPGRYGHIASMIRTQQIETSHNVQGRVYPDKRAAFKLRFLEFGTRERFPKAMSRRRHGKKVLKIQTGGGLIFRRHARGTPATHVVERTLEQAWPAAEEKLKIPLFEAVGGQ